MHNKPLSIPTRHGHATSGDDAPASLQRRADAVAACLHALPGDLPWKFLAELAPMLLQPPYFRDLPARAGELPLLSKILSEIARGVRPSDPLAFATFLAAAMFYFLPHELPLTPPPSQLPLWIRVPYLHWSLVRPQSLYEPAEAVLYGQWLGNFLGVIASDFAEGGGLADLPEYQRPRMRRLVEQQLGFVQSASRRDI